MRARRGMMLLLIGLVGCTSSGINRPVEEVTATVGQDQVQHVDVRTHAFFFEPNRIVVQSGKPVELEVHNSSWFIPHNLTVTAPETDVTVSADVGGMFGRAKMVRFTPTTPGEYEFYCHVDSHGKKGMKGTLVVK